MTTYTFQAYPAVTTAIFSCPMCGKEKRKRTFKSECTVNPFNKNDDGSVKSAREVQAQSFAQANAERDDFMRKPLCAKCEDTLPFAERQKLYESRRQR